MATTPNYGWVTPAPTDFVTDLPADFETFADAVDASFTADEGDLLVGGAANIFEPLTIGANGTVLTSDGTTASWASPGGATTSYTLLSTTTLSGSSTVTVSGLSGYNKLFGIIYQAKAGTGSKDYRIRPNNSSTAANYNWGAVIHYGLSTYGAGNLGNSSNNANGDIDFAVSSSNANSEINGYFLIDGANSTGIKAIQFAGGGTASGGTGHRAYIGHTAYDEAAVISSLSFRVLGDTFNAGSLYIYGGN
jgi:hypothetical protein